MSGFLAITVLVLLLGCLILVPLGLPGLPLMGVVTGVAALAGIVGWGTFFLAAGAALVAEGAEFLLVRRLGERFGGSRRAFWGAVLGGLAGLFVGVPVPVVGPILTAFLGTFAGAAAVTLHETRSLRAAGRVGTGTVVGRALAAGMKVAAGVFILLAVALRLAAL